jgi:tetratricopeptide (TPR) repeat protein
VPPVARARNTARQWHKQIYWEPLTAEALPPDTSRALLTRNPLDTAIWESWRSAGFDTAAVRPHPVGAAADHRFLVHEAVRPAFLAARWFKREWAPRLSPGRTKSRLRSGVAKADRARDAGQWRRAADLYRQALSEEPRAPAIWVQYGHMLKNCGEIAAAEQAYREAQRYDRD